MQKIPSQTCMTHYCSYILCLSKDNIPASIVCYSRDRCTVIGCAPVFSPHGLFLKYNLWEWKKNQNWRRRWRVCCKINPSSLELTSLSPQAQQAVEETGGWHCGLWGSDGRSSILQTLAEPSQPQQVSPVMGGSVIKNVKFWAFLDLFMIHLILCMFCNVKQNIWRESNVGRDFYPSVFDWRIKTEVVCDIFS